MTKGLYLRMAVPGFDDIISDGTPTPPPLVTGVLLLNGGIGTSFAALSNCIYLPTSSKLLLRPGINDNTITRNPQ